jgi:hypothetical protein
LRNRRHLSSDPPRAKTHGASTMYRFEEPSSGLALRARRVSPS